MRALLVAAVLSLASTTHVALADALPGDDECGPGQHWEGGHDGECSCAVGTPGPDGEGGLALWLAGIGLVAFRRRG